MTMRPDGEVFEPYPLIRPDELGRIFWTGWERPPLALMWERDVWLLPDDVVMSAELEDGRCLWDARAEVGSLSPLSPKTPDSLP